MRKARRTAFVEIGVGEMGTAQLQLPRHAPACSGVSGTPSGVSGTAFALAFAGFAFDVAGGAVLLLLGFHIANEIVRRASLPAHGGVLKVSAVLWEGTLEYCSPLNAR